MGLPGSSLGIAQASRKVRLLDANVRGGVVGEHVWRDDVALRGRYDTDATPTVVLDRVVGDSRGLCVAGDSHTINLVVCDDVGRHRGALTCAHLRTTALMPTDVRITQERDELRVADPSAGEQALNTAVPDGDALAASDLESGTAVGAHVLQLQRINGDAQRRE